MIINKMLIFNNKTLSEIVDKYAEVKLVSICLNQKLKAYS